MTGGGGVVRTIKLEEKMEFEYTYRQAMSLSEDGALCALAAGNGMKYWFLVDIENEKQSKFTSQKLYNSFTACFLNDGSSRGVIGGHSKFEIWNTESGIAEQVIACGGYGVQTTFSVGNIVAIGNSDNVLRVYNSENWEKIYSKDHGIETQTLQLTTNLKNLVLGGEGGDLCIV